MIAAVWRLLAFGIWFGVLFAICSILIAGAVVTLLGAVLFGLVSPTRTGRAGATAWLANVTAAIDLVRAQR